MFVKVYYDSCVLEKCVLGPGQVRVHTGTPFPLIKSVVDAISNTSSLTKSSVTSNDQIRNNSSCKENSSDKKGPEQPELITFLIKTVFAN